MRGRCLGSLLNEQVLDELLGSATLESSLLKLDLVLVGGDRRVWSTHGNYTNDLIGAFGDASELIDLCQIHIFCHQGNVFFFHESLYLLFLVIVFLFLCISCFWDQLLAFIVLAIGVLLFFILKLNITVLNWGLVFIRRDLL